MQLASRPKEDRTCLVGQGFRLSVIDHRDVQSEVALDCAAKPFERLGEPELNEHWRRKSRRQGSSRTVDTVDELAPHKSNWQSVNVQAREADDLQ